MEPVHGPATEHGLEQHATLTTVARQLLDVLAATQADVDADVDARVAANPVLVRGTPRRCRWCASPLRRGRCPTCSGSGADLRSRDPAAPADERDRVRLDARALVPPGAEDDVDAAVALLDDRGLLPSDAPDPPAPRLAAALAAVRAVAPPGTAERGLHASLVAQAGWHVRHGAPDLVLVLVSDHLARIGTPDLARHVGASGAALEAAMRVVRRLTPAPLPRGASDGPATPPDVVVREVDGRLVVDALGPEDLGIGLDDELTALPLEDAAAAWRDAHVAAARQLVYLLGRRADTLRRVTAVAVDVQEGFVRHGPSAHRPLTRAQVAARLGLHASTVSRVVAGAVVALPGRRVLPLADLFGTSHAARDAVAALFTSDDPPRTDAEATERLAARGIHVARRTVAKYRATPSAAR
ncbi:RNA polymerase factor sigma-54 [Cellulomonas dongxiuzhuiae]|uniref:RNA polymerase sigma-54 factor n=1 Tax=Cellulomonas dongxiuzhuiae TaxID=2819979 RepID=A0ABX8GJ24_9CELL|nr:hypothetical protein [Cellulomonas dongxiuzhuiae]MBO3095190.1 hypothetical protein [Cellulomonas dongxiuzhuiae]QWC16193.1 hypothetical protein KKR89_00450 [Cellulomonas dongxiuzhuiae]